MRKTCRARRGEGKQKKTREEKRQMIEMLLGREMTKMAESDTI
jgi:hypothetical protein